MGQRFHWILSGMVMLSAMGCQHGATVARDQSTSPADATAAREASKQWFRQAKYGVFVHFLGGGSNWNATVNAFDVKTFARQMEQACPPWFPCLLTAALARQPDKIQIHPHIRPSAGIQPQPRDHAVPQMVLRH